MRLMEVNISLVEIVAIASTLAIGFIIGYMIGKKRGASALPLDPPPTLEEVLAEMFGDATYAASFSLRDARDWVKARKDKLEVGYKAMIFKVNSKAMSMFGHKLRKINIDVDSEKFLVIAIVSVNDNEDVTDSLLVKYERLSANLEEALSKGDGVMVVEA